MNEKWHETMYKRALELANVTGPEWADLTPEQREAIREANIEHQQYMDDVGKAIATGGPLPEFKL